MRWLFCFRLRRTLTSRQPYSLECFNIIRMAGIALSAQKAVVVFFGIGVIIELPFFIVFNALLPGIEPHIFFGGSKSKQVVAFHQ